MSLENKKVLFISNYFPPISGPGSIRPYFFAKYLGESGIPLTIIAASDDPNYGLDDSFNLNLQNIEIVRFSGNEYGRFRQLLFKFRIYFPFYFLFPLRFFERQYEWVKQLEEWLDDNLQKFDLVYVTSGPFSAAIAAHKACKKKKKPYILDMRDPFTMSPARIWPSYFHWNMFSKLERTIISESYKTIVVAKGMKEELIEKYPTLSEDKVEVIFNGFNGDISTFTANENSRLNLIYAGSLHDYELGIINFIDKKYKIPYTRKNYNTSSRSLFQLIRGLHLMDKQSLANIQINIFGAHKLPNTVKMITELGLENTVIFQGKVGFGQIQKEFTKADVLLFPMEERTDGKPSYFLSGKVFEYLQANKPIFMIGQENEASTMLEEIGVLSFRSDSNAHSVHLMLKRILDYKYNNLLKNGAINDSEILKYKRSFQADQLKELLANAK